MNSGSTVTANASVVSCTLEGDSALLDLDSSRYYKLNAVGTAVWQSLDTPRTVAELQGVIASSFDVEADRCARDLDQLLQQLSAAGLVAVSDVQGS